MRGKREISESVLAIVLDGLARAERGELTDGLDLEGVIRLIEQMGPTEIIIPHISWQNDGVWGAC